MTTAADRESPAGRPPARFHRFPSQRRQPNRCRVPLALLAGPQPVRVSSDRSPAPRLDQRALRRSCRPCQPSRARARAHTHTQRVPSTAPHAARTVFLPRGSARPRRRPHGVPYRAAPRLSLLPSPSNLSGSSESALTRTTSSRLAAATRIATPASESPAPAWGVVVAAATAAGCARRLRRFKFWHHRPPERSRAPLHTPTIPRRRGPASSRCLERIRVRALPDGAPVPDSPLAGPGAA